MRYDLSALLLPLLLWTGCGETADNRPIAGDIDAIKIEANATVMAATASVQMSARVYYTLDIPDRNVTENVEWLSSNTTIATVDGLGVVHGGSAGGNVTVSGSYESFLDSVQITVYALERLEVVSPETNVTREQTLQLHAEGTFENGTKRDVSDAVVWRLGKSEENNATLEQNGTLYTGDANGTLDINISRYDVNASLRLYVTP